ncbi:hypothetical protein LCGC14_1807270, partial [marine sediment metagenome]
MANEIQKTPSPRWTRDQVELLKRTMAKGLTDDEMRLFLYVCRRTGLDPFLRQAYAIKRFDSELGDYRMAIQTGIDGYRLLAARNPGYAGSEPPIFEVDPNEPTRPVKATVVVYKFVDGEKCTFTGEARWSEYAQRTKDGSLFAMWEKMGFNQLAKCAEAQALRKGFPGEVQGITVHEEMPPMDASPDSAGFAAGKLYEGKVTSLTPPDRKAKKPGKIAVAIEGMGILGPLGFWETPEAIAHLPSPESAVGLAVQISYQDSSGKRGQAYRNLSHLA